MADNPSRAVIVVCDTNVFVRETHLLRKKGGPQLERLLRVVNGRLFIPEILRTEYLEQTRLAAGDHRTRFSSAFENFQSLTGTRSNLPLLGDDGVNQRTEERLAALAAATTSMPLNDDILVTAGQRSLQKRRPTSKTDHGYKDCLIWESVLRLPAGSEVMFVSRDNAFFDGDQFAPELVAEARARGISIAGYRELEHVVRELQANAPALDLAAAESAEIVEKPSAEETQGEAIATGSTSPVTPPTAVSAETLPAESVVALAAEQLAERLSSAQKPFQDLDTKVLGYVGFLGSATKTELFTALSQSGVAIEIARNVAERLVIAGLIRDTGNHYLPVDLAAADLAAAVVEPEMIELLTKTAHHDGQ
jgi:hypothetical protein